ncbi:exocyst complex component 6B isoform X1 [Latimeria chalumnae]|uniref:exocyst complex component 6B isoform X1 n=1 Tax=Latimeria chalumnae TaxID=7897 RepID=UPI0006D9085C|nr:PREDICTED: exocyst complex component 6B isoform X3 [Latimeria chalumnae]|eukprot:XP_014344915.1 PREDICTED: exocyst complex component 6B isoform X3 [Latimeria chalumnae]
MAESENLEPHQRLLLESQRSSRAFTLPLLSGINWTSVRRREMSVKMVELENMEAAAEHERILREIESTDTACIGPTLRSVYDGEEHGQFMDKLEGRIRNHDREIEKMCNFHYQGFVDSITELLKVRGEAQKLKSQVTDTNRKLQNEGKELVILMEDLKQCRLQQRNIAATIDKLTLCLPVLEMYSKLREQMKAKRYYPALKTMEHLEHTYLPRVNHYRFCKIMVENIPKLREEIKEVSMSDLKDFLESIRKHSNKIGETAMKQAQHQRNLDNAISQQHRAGSVKKPKKECAVGVDLDVESTSPMSEQDSGILDFEDEEDEEEVMGAQDLVDFSPVFRCLHIYSVLGARETFENYYRKQRRKQARLVLQPPSNMHETLNGYRKYFNQIVGFFVVEDHILHTTQGLVNRAYIDELWEMALSKTMAALRTHSSYCTDPNLVLDLKNLIVLFADTLQGYGFPVSQLFDMLLEIRDQYGEILLKKWAAVFRQILDLDNYSPIPVANEEEYKRTMGQFPFQDSNLEKQPFPKKFPFSEFVPKVYSQIKEFIYACLKFSEDLHLSSTEIDDMIRKSTNLLLSRTLSNCLQAVIKKKNVGLTELVQIIINTTHLEQSCRYLEEFITNITDVPPETVHTTKLYGTSTFKDARHTAEEEIYTNLNQKIDQFLQLADYEWMAAESTGRASDYLTDLIAFLRSTFTVFTHLPGNVDEHATMPGKVAQTACMSACKHLSTSLLQLLLEAEVKQITIGAIQQFNLDIKECEQFARSGPVPGFQGDTLQLAFIDLRQLLDLFILWDWSTYLADYGQPHCKYLRVNPTTALALLEKMKDTSRKNNVFAQFRKNERDKQKLIDTVAKQLRSLINSHHS